MLERRDTPCRPFFIQLFHVTIISHIEVAWSRIFYKALRSLAVQGFEASRTASLCAPRAPVLRPVRPSIDKACVIYTPCVCAPLRGRVVRGCACVRGVSVYAWLTALYIPCYTSAPIYAPYIPGCHTPLYKLPLHSPYIQAPEIRPIIRP